MNVGVCVRTTEKMGSLISRSNKKEVIKKNWSWVETTVERDKFKNRSMNFFRLNRINDREIFINLHHLSHAFMVNIGEIPHASLIGRNTQWLWSHPEHSSHNKANLGWKPGAPDLLKVTMTQEKTGMRTERQM